MFQRFLLCGALTLLSSAALASDGPAWGLIVKLKPESEAQIAASAPTPSPRAQALSVQPAALGHARLQSAMQRVGLGSLAHRPLHGGALHHVGTEQIVSHEQAQALARQLMVSGAVEWAVPNEREHLQAAPPNDPYFVAGTQWWASSAGGTDSDPLPQRLRGVPNLLPTWTSGTTGSNGPIVAVLDTGLISHEDIDNTRIVAGQNFHHGEVGGTISSSLDQPASNTTDPGDYVLSSEATATCPEANSSWHGTAVTGVIAAHANNGTGIAGVNWGVRIMPVRIAGKCGAWESDIIAAMNWVAGDGNGNVKRADIINLSFGGAGQCDNAYLATLKTLKQRGVVVIIAAGNEQGEVSRPANCVGNPGTENVVSVTALNRDGYKASYSNFGSHVTLATVGGDPPATPCSAGDTRDCGVVTLGNEGATTVDTNPSSHQYFYYAGTSMAAPITAGVAALVWGANPSLTADQVASTLQASTRQHRTAQETGLPACSASNSGQCACDTSTCGSGILDAYQAIQMATTNPPSAIASPPENRGGGGGAFGSLALLALAGTTAATARSLRAPRSRRA